MTETLASWSQVGLTWRGTIQLMVLFSGAQDVQGYERKSSEIFKAASSGLTE
jgi:hypothetical protein